MEKNSLNAIVIDDKDTVAVVIEPAKAGDPVQWADNGGARHQVTANADIPIYHKIAIKDLAKGEPVVKYGEHIGLAAMDIHAGDHVHTHNVENHREEL